jgi:hypothetical protein
MVEAPICPVCGNILRATGVNPNMYYCTKRKVWVSDLGMHLDIVDATIYVEPVSGRQTLKIIEVAPYSFTITDDVIKKTEVRKIMPEERIPGMRRTARNLERKKVLSIEACMKLPWNDKEKVLERMKLYLLFS